MTTPISGRIARLPRDTVESIAFFSRLPSRSGDGPFDMRVSAAAWPLAGLVIALAPAVLLIILRLAGVPPTIAAALALAALAALTGAMHEDGLSDAADGIGGGGDRARKLEIMRDSRLGTYGALALVFSILIRVAALATLAVAPLAGAIALLGVAALSRAIALWHWNALLPARMDGLAKAAGRPDWAALLIGLALGAIAFIALLIGFGFSALFALGLAVLGSAGFTILCRRQLGGHTGDTIGAAQQIAETLLLVGLSAGWTTAILIY